MTPILALGQIKEVNFPGKSWYLHGYDFRIKPRIYGPLYFDQIVRNADYPNTEYLSFFENSIGYSESEVISLMSSLSAGFVFKPFHVSDYRYLRQIEIVQNIEINYNHHDFSYVGFQKYEGYVGLRSFQLGYNPRFVVSSPTFADYLKAYIAGDGYLYLPIQHNIYNQIPDSVILNSGQSYEKGKHTYSDRITASTFETGLGATFGIKMNIDCNWNFHVEYNQDYLLNRFSTTKTTIRNRRYGIQFGLRYKFGIPNSGDAEGEYKPSGFW